ncbi:hypothetical protein H5T56_01750 [Candidatus Bipolaricaulota bacterium]|nr:hypothetical protein [Candidatus Bipolaricaulota bacterium]
MNSSINQGSSEGFVSLHIARQRYERILAGETGQVTPEGLTLDLPPSADYVHSEF